MFILQHCYRSEFAARMYLYLFVAVDLNYSETGVKVGRRKV
jgi:hypothetical protein